MNTTQGTVASIESGSRVTILSQEHANQIVEVVNGRGAFSGITDPKALESIREQQFKNTHNLLDATVQNSGLGRIFGLFDEVEKDRLDAVMYTAISDAQVCYYLTRAHTHPRIANGPRGLSRLISYTVRYYESLGYYRFYTMYRERHIAAYQKLWRTSESLEGYVSYSELKMRANERPRQTEIWERVYGRILFPEPTVVRAFVRPFVDVIDRRVV